MALNTGKFIKTGAFSSDTREFSKSVSSTDIYCTDITVNNNINATVHNDLHCNGNVHYGLATVFSSTIDTDLYTFICIYK